MFTSFESSRLSFNGTVSIPVFALRGNNRIADSLAIHEELEARAFETRSNVSEEHVFTSGSHLQGVFHPFASLRVTHGIALCLVGRIELNNVYAIFAIDVTFVHKILVVERNTLATFIVIFHFNHARNRHVFNKRGLRNDIGEIS